MDIEKRVTELAEEKIAELERPDLFLVDVKMHSNGKLIILVDGDKGIGIAECAQISRFVGFKLEEEGVIDEAYNLEVSSPGIDTPLQSFRQYGKNVGRQVSLKMTDGGKREGTLKSVSDEAVVLEENVKQKGTKAAPVESVIPLVEITETKVIISFK